MHISVAICFWKKKGPAFHAGPFFLSDLRLSVASRLAVDFGSKRWNGHRAIVPEDTKYGGLSTPLRFGRDDDFLVRLKESERPKQLSTTIWTDSLCRMIGGWPRFACM